MNPVLILTVVLKAWLHLCHFCVNFLLHLTGSSPITSSQLAVCELVSRMSEKSTFIFFVMQSFLDPLEPKEESAEVKVFNLNHISSVQVEMLEARNHFLMISNIQRHLQVCSSVLQSRAGKVREVPLCTLSKS